MDSHINDKSEIDIKKFKKIGTIDNGSYGFVYKVKEIKTGIIYAAKTLNGSNDEEKSIDREVDIMLFASHPAIVKFVGYSRKDFSGSDCVTIIMEYAKNGSLGGVLDQIQKGKKPPKFTNTIRQIIIAGIARGMQYLHNHNIIHRDLKPHNVLLDENYYPYVTDFGLSKYFLEGNSHSQSIFLGTVVYEAPEINKESAYDTKIDVYAFGIILFQIVTDLVPYPELVSKKISQIQLVNKVINDDYRPVFKENVNKNIKKLIEKCWSPDPNKRPNFNEIFEKLSNINGDNKYLLDGVKLDKFNKYIEYVQKVDDRLEKQLDRVIAIKNETQRIKKDNEELEAKCEKLENENKELNNEKELLESKNVQLKQDNARKTKRLNLLKKRRSTAKVKKTKKTDSELPDDTVTAKKDDDDDDDDSNATNNQLSTENEWLKEENEKHLNEIQNLKKTNTELEADLKKQIKRKNKIMKENEQLNDRNDQLEIENNEKNDRINRLLNNNKQLRVRNRELINSLKSKDTKEEEKDKEAKSPQKNYENFIKVTTVSSFNSYPLIFQKQITENLSKSTLIDETNQLFSNLNDLIQYFLQLESVVTPSIEIIANKDCLIKDINEEHGILIHHEIIEALFQEEYLESPDLLRVLNVFDNICLEVKYPIDSFDDVYDRVLNIKKKSTEKNNVSISIYINKEYHFVDDNNINYVKFDSSIESTGSFINCSSIEQIEIPSSVTQIENNAFYGCTALSQVVISSSVKRIGEGAFFGCYLLVQITIPSSVTEIERDAFHGCSSLKEVIIQSPLTSIKEDTFHNCSSLQQIVIPSSVKCIENNAFTGCSSLKEIKIPSAVSEIGGSCFSGCSSLEQITFEINCLLTEINGGTFSGCNSLTKITIPSRVESILEGAFCACSSLVHVSIPSSVKYIGEGSFAGCSSLENLIIPPSVTSIKEGAFSGCFSLKQVSIPYSVKYIGEGCFCDCNSLNSISLPSSIKSIRGTTFAGCSSLVNVIIPSSVTEIDDGAFSGCSSLVEVTIPNSVTKLGKSTFAGCSSLVHALIPSSLTPVDESTFDGCSPLLQISNTLKDRSISGIFSKIINNSKLLK